MTTLAVAHPVDLDGWTRRVLRRHFDPDTGSPFWLRRRDRYGFDPRDIEHHDELVALGPLDLDEVRDADPLDLVPLSAGRPLAGRIRETAGTIGRPVRLLETEAMARHAARWRLTGLRAAGFAPGRTWLCTGPGGPHPVTAAAIANELHAMVYSLDVDARWIMKLIRGSRMAEINLYVDHLLGELTDILAGGGIDYLEITPALFAALLQRPGWPVTRLAGVALSGTQLTPAMYREFSAALAGGVVATAYTNALGGAVGMPPAADGALLPYLPHYPQVTMDVVDPREPDRLVGYGESGRLRVTVLHDDLLLPNVLERDQAVRIEPPSGAPVDGVANIVPLHTAPRTLLGIY